MGAGHKIVLASGSSARRQMLAAAGVVFAVEPAQLDEAELSDIFIRHTTCVPAIDLARYLADAKAIDVSMSHPGALVIGSDQVLAQGERLFSKAGDLAGARRTLLALRGQTHQLHSAVAIALDGKVVWSDADTASLTMRAFSDGFLESYLEAAGDALLWSVGCYELEGRGVQLFERIEGDYFTILGMPLLRVLAELRKRGALLA
jgi:septum formation protein